MALLGYEIDPELDLADQEKAAKIFWTEYGAARAANVLDKALLLALFRHLDSGDTSETARDILRAMKALTVVTI